MGFIYKITNIKTGKMYVGQTRQSIQQRWQEHQSSSRTSKENSMLYRAMRKYGVDNFKIEQITECDNSLLNVMEKYWIKKLGTYGKGYNMNEGGNYLNLPKISQKLIDDWQERFINGESITHIAKTSKFSYATIQKYISTLQNYDELSTRNLKNASKYVDKSVYDRKYKQVNVKAFINKIDPLSIDYPLFVFFFAFKDISINEFLSLNVKDIKNKTKSCQKLLTNIFSCANILSWL